MIFFSNEVILSKYISECSELTGMVPLVISRGRGLCEPCSRDTRAQELPSRGAAPLAPPDGQRELGLALAVLSAPCDGEAELPGPVLIPLLSLAAWQSRSCRTLAPDGAVVRDHLGSKRARRERCRCANPTDPL